MTGFPYDTTKKLDESVDIESLPVITFTLEKKGGGNLAIRVGPHGYLDEWCVAACPGGGIPPTH